MIAKKECEYLREIAKQQFDKVRGSWVQYLTWAAPHRGRWINSQTEGERNNQHIVDATHILALRSYVAGFLEGNTSATRPWYRSGTSDEELNKFPAHHEWLDAFTRRTLKILNSGSNFYHAAGQFYYDFGVVNTGAHYIDERESGLFFHTLMPGSYYIINNGYGEAIILVREFNMTVKALVDYYGKKKNGEWDWSNFSTQVRKMYEDGNYTEQVQVAHIVKENPMYDGSKPEVLANRRWISVTYEIGGMVSYAQEGTQIGAAADYETKDHDRYLKISYSRRKPFIVGKSTEGSFEYGEMGPTSNSLGLIKSLNKKAIGKDQALDQMLRPPLQGPANLKKSYITSAPNAFIPLDAQSIAKGAGLRTVFEINPAIGALIQDVSDLRQMVDKLYYADYLLYLSSNPKTRTARETDAIVREQQLVIGPNLQSLNWTYNVPVLDFVMDYVLFDDPWVEENPVPEAMVGKFLRPEFISVFAQAQKAADLPNIDRYIMMATEVGQIRPEIWDKVNLDKLADLYEDRLYLPAGLNNPQSKVEAKREAAMAQAQQQQMMQETLPAMAGAAKDVGLKLAQ